MFGRQRSRDDVEQLDAHRFRYLPTGAEVFERGRDEVGYSLAGRTWTVFVERGPVQGFFPDAQPRWDDGTPVTAAEQDAARVAFEAVYEVQNIDVEMVPPGGGA